MKKSFKDLIKGIVMSSLAAIAGTHGTDAAPAVKFNDADSYSRSGQYFTVK